MKTKPLLLPAILQAVLLLCFGFPGSIPAQAPPPPPARPDTAQLLREALFDEQGTRDLAKAAAGYEKVIAAYDAERQLAATALYRLAEVRRAQNKKDEATAFYQRLLTEFPTHDPLARLSRENLAALGAKEIPGAGPAVADAQDARIAELKRMLKDSPDLVLRQDEDSPLTEASEDGQTKVVKFLLEIGAKPGDWDLLAAASEGHLGVCELLLAQGAPLKLAESLEEAVRNGHKEVVRLLLAKGAPTGETLYDSITRDYPEITNLLIEAKANPNPPLTGRSVLYFAVRNGNEPLVKRLLAIGGDVRVRCLDSSMPNINDNNGSPRRRAQEAESISTASPEGWSLLHAAVMSGNIALLDLLLPGIKDLDDPGHSGKQTALSLAIQTGQDAWVERLLQAGANAKGLGSDGQPLLLGAVLKLNEPLVKQLLAAGADPRPVGPDGQTVLTPLRDGGEKALPLIRLLVAAGADPEAGKYSLMNQTDDTLAVRLAREFRYPTWAASKQITLSLPESGGFSVPLAIGTGPSAPPGLADLLLEAKFEWREKPAPDWTTLHLFRRDPQGIVQEQIIPDWLEGKVPVLEWGDVVEFVSADWQKPGGSGGNLKAGLPTEIQRRLQTALVRHVTVNLDGKSYPMTLRGSLKVYNPLKAEAPLTDAVKLMNIMGGLDPRWFHGSVRVKRLASQGGGEISALLQKGAIIPLKEGDILDLTGDPVTWERHRNGISVMRANSPAGNNLTTEDYTEDIVLLSPDLPYAGVIRGLAGDSPSLLQFLSAAYPPLDSGAMIPNEGASVGNVKNLTEQNAPQRLKVDYLQSVLPHPDWSQIKIRRIGENREVIELPVDLAAAIAACTDDTSGEEARKADVPLMAGDVILLPIRQDQKDQPWTGWDAATIRFFSKALAIQVTLANEDGSFRGLNLEYLPVRFVETSAGLLGLPAKEPAPQLHTYFTSRSLLTAMAPGKWFSWMQRAGATERIEPGRDPRSQLGWLREGDTIGYANQQPSPPPVVGPTNPIQPTNPIPRRRTILPPAPGQ